MRWWKAVVSCCLVFGLIDFIDLIFFRFATNIVYRYPSFLPGYCNVLLMNIPYLKNEFMLYWNSPVEISTIFVIDTTCKLWTSGIADPDVWADIKMLLKRNDPVRKTIFTNLYINSPFGYLGKHHILQRIYGNIRNNFWIIFLKNGLILQFRDKKL